MSGINVKLKYNDAEYTGEINQIKQEGGQVGGDEALVNALVDRATAETNLHINNYKLMLFNEQIYLLNKLKDFYDNTSNSLPEDLQTKIDDLQSTIDKLTADEETQREQLKQKNNEALAQIEREDAAKIDKEAAKLTAAIAAKNLLEGFNKVFEDFIKNTNNDMQILLNTVETVGNDATQIKADIKNYQSNVDKMNEQVTELFLQLQERKGEAQTMNDTNKEAGKIIWNIKSNNSNLVNAINHDLIETFNPLHYDKDGINVQTAELDSNPVQLSNASEPDTKSDVTIDDALIKESKSFFQKVMDRINKLKPVKTVTLDTGYGAQGNDSTSDIPTATALTTNKKSASTLKVSVKMKDKDGNPKGTYSGNLTRKTTFADRASNATRTVKNVVPFIQKTLGLDINSKKTQIRKMLNNNNNPSLDDLNTMVNIIENIKNKEPNDADLPVLIKDVIGKINDLTKSTGDSSDSNFDDNDNVKLGELRRQLEKLNQKNGGKTRNKRMRPRRHTTYKYKPKPKPKPKPK